ncbi:MAG: translation initiation factor IF-3 [Candidatus Nealsonbacteria bacterium]
MIKKPLVNNRIRAPEIRLIDDAGKQVGIVSLEKALQMARERNLDLIQVTDKADPPVCKIMDYGKYLYRLQKKEKKVKKSTGIKGIRLRFNISSHDLETRVLQAEKFLKKGNKVKVEMVLRGREKRLSRFAKEKVSQFIEDLKKRIPIKPEGELKRTPRGFIIIISSSKEQQTTKDN